MAFNRLTFSQGEKVFSKSANWYYPLPLGEGGRFVPAGEGGGMLISVRVVPRAKQNKVVAEADRLKVYLTAPPVEGKANDLLIEVLAEHLGVKKKQLRLIRGEKGRDKIVEVL